MTCTAVDASRNSATATFVVHVRGAAEQTAALIDRVVLQKFEKRGLTNSLLAKLTAAQRALLAPSRNNRANARHQLDAFVHEVTAQTGKAVVEPVARDLIGRALRIEAVIG